MTMSKRFVECFVSCAFCILLFAGCSTVSEMGCMELNPEKTDANALVSDLRECVNLAAVADRMKCPPVGTFHDTNNVTWAIWCYCKHTIDTGCFETTYGYDARSVFCKFRQDKLIGFSAPVGDNDYLWGDIALPELSSYELMKILWPIYRAAHNNACGLSMYFDDQKHYWCEFESGREVDHWEGMTAHFKPAHLTSTNGYKRVYAISRDGQSVYCDIPADATYKRYEGGKFYFEREINGSSNMGLCMALSAVQNLNQISQTYSTSPHRVQSAVPSKSYNQASAVQSSVKTTHQAKSIPKYTIVPRAPSFGWGLDGNATDGATRSSTGLQRVK